MHPEALTKEGAELVPYLKRLPGFYLAGGTALALQLGHRVSADFDLFNPHEIPEDFVGLAQEVFAGRELKTGVNNKSELTMFVDDTKITFLKYPFPVLRPLVSWRDLLMLDTQELAATKAYTIGRRGTLKDYVDLYFILAGNMVTLDQIIDLARRKYDNNFNDRLFLEQLVYLKDIEEAKIIFLKEPKTKSQMEGFFVEEIKKIKL